MSHNALQDITVVRSIPDVGPCIFLCRPLPIPVAIGQHIVAFHRFFGVLIAQSELIVLIIEELAPPVRGARQEIVEALVILHQVGEDMLCIDLVFSFPGHLLYVLHARCVGSQLYFCAVPGDGEITDLTLQDLFSKPFRRERFTILLKGHHHIGAVDFQRHIHPVGILARNDLVDIIVATHDNIVALKLHQLGGKEFVQLILAGEGLNNLIIDILRLDKDICLNIVWAVNLLVELCELQCEQESQILLILLFSPRFIFLAFSIVLCLENTTTSSRFCTSGHRQTCIQFLSRTIYCTRFGNCKCHLCHNSSPYLFYKVAC